MFAGFLSARDNLYGFIIVTVLVLVTYVPAAFDQISEIFGAIQKRRIASSYRMLKAGEMEEAKNLTT
jgi:hypothetical protein